MSNNGVENPAERLARFQDCLKTIGGLPPENAARYLANNGFDFNSIGNDPNLGKEMRNVLDAGVADVMSALFDESARREMQKKAEQKPAAGAEESPVAKEGPKIEVVSFDPKRKADMAAVAEAYDQSPNAAAFKVRLKQLDQAGAQVNQALSALREQRVVEQAGIRVDPRLVKDASSFIGLHM